MSFLGGLTAGLPIVGDAISMGMAQHNYNEQDRFAREQFAFQRQKWEDEKTLANTAHQREMADLKKAGLNPILAVTRGGSPVPSGGGSGPGTVAQPRFSFEATGKGIASAGQLRLEEKRVENESKLAEASVIEKAADAEQKRALARVAESQVGVAPAQIREMDARTVELASRTRLNDAEFREVLSKVGVNEAQVREIAAKINLIKAQENEAGWSAKYTESRIPKEELYAEFAKFAIALLGGKGAGANAGARWFDWLDNPFGSGGRPGGATGSWAPWYDRLLDSIKGVTPQSGVTHGGAHSARQVDHW